MTQATEKYVTPDRLDAAISRLRADIEKRFSEQTRRLVGWMTGLVAIATTVIIAVLQ